MHNWVSGNTYFDAWYSVAKNGPFTVCQKRSINYNSLARSFAKSIEQSNGFSLSYKRGNPLQLIERHS
jgi:hypothetical protein